MIDHETRKAAMFEAGRAAALLLQKESTTMNGTQLNSSTDIIPDFQAAKAQKNMLEREAGNNGFICKSTAGRVVRLIQNYDSNIYTDEPEQLSAQWGFVWSKNPEHALPFISIATSPYMKDEVCSFEDIIYKSTHDNNIWSPSEYPDWWEKIDSSSEQPEEPEKWPEFKKPSGAHDAYYNGDKITFEGAHYICIAPEGTACVWSPTAYPNYWQKQE